MEALLISTSTVALAEIGDKTQLLSLFLTTKFRNKWAIIMGILVATLLNHGVSAWLGDWITQYLQGDLGRWLIGASFVLLGLWLLVPDKDDSAESPLQKYGAFVASTLLFFVAEIGDKTQIATVLLGAQFNSVVLVTIGTTLGMLLANVPVVLAGDYLMRRIPLKLANILAAFTFIAVGIASLVI
ncbi:TMEM165/GDT1 family protein [Ketobacter sp. MCCC 1A13808]|uniref:TMEM165/GDT1 family protein n=1 Tax=Ketobacter sp. MCCC 1A13808 TaxID=2602738 RepID=UPI000F0F1FF8|nr:TMEM165/GDT1 family protein [Ketobacter sp. MCCC 1A13808]MVF14294.1 TMEM165/GDT1 family protein [Ketobacter sp. MCCC 1A13808]RLP53544.1 MAG: TMEM165/GDT1 family protein [Ketobacter sp.]